MIEPRVLWGVAALALALGAAAGALRWGQRLRARERLLSSREPAARAAERGLRPWLSRAGVRAPGAPFAFSLAAVSALLLGLGFAWAGARAGIAEGLARGAAALPGPAGVLLAGLFALLPQLAGLAVALAPWIWLRARRRARAAALEADLPVVLELLATLSEAGIGFESAVERVLASQRRLRPLAQELRTYQRDLLAGAGRTRALVRLAERAGVEAIGRVAAALVQAEQLGSGISDVLRAQSNDLREHARERALARAEQLEVKLVFPLVICFLPGLFVAVVGPSVYQFVQLIDRILRQGS